MGFHALYGVPWDESMGFRGVLGMVCSVWGSMGLRVWGSMGCWVWCSVSGSVGCWVWCSVGSVGCWVWCFVSGIPWGVGYGVL